MLWTVGVVGCGCLWMWVFVDVGVCRGGGVVVGCVVVVGVFSSCGRWM